jgi:hypothetical protein
MGHHTTIMTEARKVSFEESPMPPSPRLHSVHSSSSGSLPRTSCCRDLSGSSQLMRRPTNGFCLSKIASFQDLDLDADQDDQYFDSPVSVTCSSEGSSSPWGHFVDVIPQSEEDSQSCHVSTTSLTVGSSLHSFQPYYKPKREPIRKSRGHVSGFVLSIPSTILTSTDDVEGALKRMQM